MLDESGPFPALPLKEAAEEAAPVNPYGDVALGVECAWPEVLPVLEPHEHTDG